MKNFLILRILDIFKFLFGSLDYDTIRLILQLKFAANSKSIKFIDTKQISDTFLYIFFGIIIALPVIIIYHKSLFLSLFMFFSLNMMFVFLSLIKEFSVSFLDITDNELLLPLPINPKDLNIAKILYIFLFFMQTTFYLSLPSILLYAHFWGLLQAFVVIVVLIFFVLFLIGFTSTCYGVLLRMFSGEKLKDFIAYFQIIATILTLGLYWLLNGSNKNIIEKINLFSQNKSLYFLPPAWFAGMVKSVFKFDNSTVNLAIIGLVLSTAVYLIYLKLVLPYYEKNLYKIKKTEPLKSKKTGLNFTEKLFAKFDFSPFYEFSLRILSTDRKIKLLAYPVMAKALLFSTILPFFNIKDKPVSDSKAYFLLYIILLFFIQLQMLIKYSEFFEASQLFRYLPLGSPKKLIKGALFAIHIKYQLPLFIIVSISYLFIWRFSILPFIIITYLNGLIILLLFQLVTKNTLPFSKEPDSKKLLQEDGTAYFLSFFVFIPSSLAIYYLFTLLILGKIYLIILQILLILLLWKTYFDKLDLQKI